MGLQVFCLFLSFAGDFAWVEDWLSVSMVTVDMWSLRALLSLSLSSMTE